MISLDIALICEARIKEAKEGLKILMEIYDKYQANQYVLFPDEVMLKDGVKFFPVYRSRFPNDYVFILFFYKNQHAEMAKNLMDKFVKIEVINEKIMKKILEGYALCDMSDKLTVVSVKKPYDTNAEFLIGKRGVGKKEIVCFDIYGLDRVPE